MLNRLKDVFASFDRHDVRYVVIGGIAAILHGVPFYGDAIDGAWWRSLGFIADGGPFGNVGL